MGGRKRAVSKFRPIDRGDEVLTFASEHGDFLLFEVTTVFFVDKDKVQVISGGEFLVDI